MNLAVAVFFVRCQKITESQMPQDAIETVSIAPRIPQESDVLRQFRVNFNSN